MALERLKLWVISTLGYYAIRAIGCTLRFHVEGWENHKSIHAAGKRIIYTFWHGRIFPSSYFFRHRGIVVMTSRNKDGEYIARVIRRLGYGAARGSSSRGARGALVEMIRELRKGKDVAFTIDGPRGPRYIAKPGAAWLAAKTGNPIFPFHVAAERRWVLSSWDEFQIPQPFSRVIVLMGTPIYVKAEATEQDLEETGHQIQRALEELLQRGDSYWGHKPAMEHKCGRES